MAGDLNCPYCLWPMKADDDAETCPHCAARYHAECWIDNDGCGTFGCPAWAAAQGGVALPVPPPAASEQQAATAVLTTDQLTEAERRFCEMCGERVVNDDRFCFSCGHPL